MLNKKQKIFSIIIVSTIAVISIIAIILSSIVLYNQNRPEKDSAAIFTESLNNVVELKAETENVGESFGTAILVGADGTFVTNAHIITYTSLGTAILFDEFNIRFAFEEKYRKVECVKYDTKKDLAVLKLVNAKGLELKPIKFGNSEAIRAGDTVYAVGNSSNYGIGISKGIISVPLVSVSLDGVPRSVIQSDITITAGNSGGALLNDSGELVGITTFRIKDFQGNVVYGVAYSIPMKTIKTFI